MLFNSFEYFCFLVIVFLGYFACPFRFRWLLLLIASYVFYMAWRWEYIFLIVGQTLVNFYCGRRIAHSENLKIRRMWLAGALVWSLGLLFFFKYYEFVYRSISAVGSMGGIGNPMPTLNLILPVGISFYTFQTLSYTLDVYYNKIDEETHLGRFALFVSFFPQLVAGPIERASNLLVQFRRNNKLDIDRLSSGAKLILWGLFKKVVIADRLALYVDRVYGDPQAYSGSTLLLATYFFAFQIYCDFSGYSDIAIGSARLLGYDLMQNFRLPYFAASFSDFWHRWHISLSTWFRDYLYLPLGGNRVAYGRWTVNIITVFILSGLWHGANLTFVLWGSIHGMLYLVEGTVSPYTERACEWLRIKKSSLLPFRVFFTFNTVVFAWIFFRAQSIGDALTITNRIFTDFPGQFYPGPSQITTLLGLLLIIFLILIQFMQQRGLVYLYNTGGTWPIYVRWTSYVALILCISIFGISNNEFIYFQF